MPTFEDIFATPIEIPEPWTDIEAGWQRNGYRWYLRSKGGWYQWRLHKGTWRFFPYRLTRGGIPAWAPASLWTDRVSIATAQATLIEEIQTFLKVDDPEADSEIALRDIINEQNAKIIQGTGADENLLQDAGTLLAKLTSSGGGFLLVHPDSFVERMLDRTVAIRGIVKEPARG